MSISQLDRHVASSSHFTLINNVFSFTFLDFPLIVVHLKVAERNVSITWLPAFKGECHVSGYLVYYRKVISEVKSTGQWKKVIVSQYNATNHNLQLQCYMEYEITVTAQNADGESPLNQSNVRKVKTGGGKYSQNQQQGVQLTLLSKGQLDDSVMKF